MPKLVIKEDSAFSVGSPEISDAEIPGLHIMGDFYECRCGAEFLWQIKPVKKKCLSFIQEVGLTAVGEKFHKFKGGGITGVIVLAESHMSVHTWPERGYVSVDVYVCSYTEDNRPHARKLYDRLTKLFLPSTVKFKEVERL